MSTLSLGPPAVALARDAPVMAGVRPVATPIAAETARALRPVEAMARGIALRNPSARERPVGPPPAFEVSVLEDLRDRLRRPVEAVAAPPDVAEFSAARTSAAADAVARLPATADAPQPHLDKKV